MTQKGLGIIENNKGVISITPFKKDSE